MKYQAPKIDAWLLMNPTLSVDTQNKMYSMTLREVIAFADRIAKDAPETNTADATHDEQQLLVVLHGFLTGMLVPCVAAALDPLVNPYFEQDDDDDDEVITV